MKTARNALLLLLFVCWGLAPAHAQTAEAAAGLVLGSAAGALVSAGFITAESRAGRFFFSFEDARWRLLPVPAGAAFGAVLGHRNSDRFWSGVEAGTIGLALGAGVGALAGRVAWEGAEGVWAGAVIGGAAGLLVGTMVGTLGWQDERRPSPPVVTLSIPLGP